MNQMVKKITPALGAIFDKEANLAAIRAARPGKQTWYDFRPDLLSYPRESSKGAAVVDAIVEIFCRRNMSFTVADIEACRVGVPEAFVRGAVASQLSDLVRDEYIRRTSAGHERVPPESLDEFSGRGNGGEPRRKQIGTDVEREIVAVEIELEGKGDFDPASIKDERTRVLTSIVRRRGQPAFRRMLLSAYNSRCAISNCGVDAVLEAAHIVPYQGEETNRIGNGLLLRADLHTLFDLQLISVDESTMQLLISQTLIGTNYEEFRGQRLIVPYNIGLQPSVAALKDHRERSGLHPAA